jgi:hypothetical protein
VSITLFDLQGKAVVSIPATSKKAGTYTELLRLGDYGLSAGRYVMHLNAGTVTRTAEIYLK